MRSRRSDAARLGVLGRRFPRHDRRGCARRDCWRWRGMARGEFVCVPMQGRGTFAVEAMLGTLIPRDGKVLVLANGAYGLRAARRCAIWGAHTVIDKGDYLPPRGDEVARRWMPTRRSPMSWRPLRDLVGHPEPGGGDRRSGGGAGRKLLIDSMSAFGAVPLDLRTHLPFRRSCPRPTSASRGCPASASCSRGGRAAAAKGNSHSLALDLHAQWAYMEKTGQWRYTPPTHVVAAFLKALDCTRPKAGRRAAGALCRQPRRAGRRHARARVRDAAGRPLAVADHRHLLQSGRSRPSTSPASTT
jgi:2-aminoethylphosphonate-pyruvate transaminase